MLEMMTSSLLKKIAEPGLEFDPEMFQKLVATDGASKDWFGWSVAVSTDGLTVVVGANRAETVYVYAKQANGSYLQAQKLKASDGAANDYFGESLAITADGSTLLVGAGDDDDKGTNSGSAYIFTKQTDGSYLETQKLVAADGSVRDYFGYSLAMTEDGSTLLVGALFDDVKGTDSGSAYIFTKQANGSYLETQKIAPADGAANDQFGYSVAISGDGSTVVVGTSGDDDKGSNSGSAYIFTKQANGSYLETQKPVALDGAANDYFGYSLALSRDGSTIVVGAHCDDDKGADSGSAYIFTKQANGSYMQTQKLVPADGASKDYFGMGVAVSADGSSVVVGAFYVNDTSAYSRSAYIFTKQADGSYLQTHKLLTNDGKPATYNNYVGSSVAVSNTSVVIGAFDIYNKGAAYVY